MWASQLFLKTMKIAWLYKHRQLAALQKYLELKVLPFCQCISGPHKCLVLTFNLISATFGCKIGEKLILPLCKNS